MELGDIQRRTGLALLSRRSEPAIRIPNSRRPAAANRTFKHQPCMSDSADWKLLRVAAFASNHPSKGVSSSHHQRITGLAKLQKASN